MRQVSHIQISGFPGVAPFLRQPDALVLGMESEEEAEARPGECDQ